MNKEEEINNARHICPEIEQFVQYIHEIVSKKYEDPDVTNRINKEWQKAGKRWIVNTSITKVLSESLNLPKSDIIELLANETEGLDPKDELTVAVLYGLTIMGYKFKKALTKEIRHRLLSIK
jgi:hypothetical protein